MKLTLKEIQYILDKSRSQLLTEISNNAIETMLKTANPELVPFFNQRMADICVLKDENGQFNMMRGYLCPKIGINPDEGLACGDMKLKDWLRLNILKEFHINRGNGPLRYLKGIVRICNSNEIGLYNDIDLDGHRRERYKIFKQLISFMHSHNIEMDEDLNGLSFVNLEKQIMPLVRRNKIKKYAERIESDDIFNSGDYVVKEIPSFSEASKYGKYTDWCVTQGASHFKDYTNDNSKFFFCLKNGFENVPRQKGENCPLDEYGLSMVSVCVTPNGYPAYVTTRWNHEYDGENNKNLKTFNQIESVLGIPMSVFLENISPEIKNDDFQYALENTNLPIKSIFRIANDMQNGLTIVGYYDDDNGQMMYNCLNGRKLLSDTWYIDFRVLDDEFIQTQGFDNSYNIFDKRGKVFPQDVNGYVTVYDKKNDIYQVRMGRYENIGFNLIDRQGNKLLPENMKEIGNMNNGYAVVRNKNGELNFINSEFKFIWSEWKKGLTIYKERAWYYFIDGIAIVVTSDGLYNYLNIETGEILMPTPQSKCENFLYGYGKVKNDSDLFNLVDKNGEFLFDTWFTFIGILRDGYFSVRLQPNEGVALMNKEGDILSDKRWAAILFFDDRYGCVQEIGNTDEYIVIDSNFNEVLRTKHLVASSFPNDRFLVISWQPSISTNVMTLDGKLLLPDSFLQADSFTKDKEYCTLVDYNNVPKYRIKNNTGEIIKL